MGSGDCPHPLCVAFNLRSLFYQVEIRNIRGFLFVCS